MLISYFRILTCCSFALMRTKLMKKVDRNLPKITEEEDFSQCLEILLWIIIKKIRMDWQVFETFCRRETSESIDSYKKLTLASFFAICSVFYKDQRRKDGSDFETGTVPVFKMLQR